jgi:hypothetical protein
MSDFWYDQRKKVTNTLEDLEVFIEVGGSSVNEVLTLESFEPVATSLLLRPIWRTAKPDLKRAEIAKLFIPTG